MSDGRPAIDLDLRLVRYFTVVAEHRHFGRAAEALHITQPSLSRQIRHLEQQLGARLLDRTPQGSQLTEAGEVFLPLARALLRSAAQAAAAHPGRRPAQPGHHRLHVEPHRHPRGARAAPPHPDADVQTLHLDWDDAARGAPRPPGGRGGGPAAVPAPTGCT